MAALKSIVVVTNEGVTQSFLKNERNYLPILSRLLLGLVTSKRLKFPKLGYLLSIYDKGMVWFVDGSQPTKISAQGNSFCGCVTDYLVGFSTH